jgi:predicted nuclease of predicted toxin-antitoxin system
MKFLADMGISRRTIAWLRKQGHDALHARELGMQRASDADVLALARGEERVLLKLDLDFGYLMATSGAKLPSVVIFRLGNQTAEFVIARLADVLKHCLDDLQMGAIISVEEAAIRVRRLPIQPG